MIFLNRLKELRKEKGLSLKEVADSVDLAESQLSYYENGKRQPRDMETWKNLANFFKVSVGYVMGISDEKIDEEIALEIAKKIFNNALKRIDNFEERERKAFEYFKSKDIDTVLKDLMKHYFSIPVVMENKDLLELKDLSFLEFWLPYSLWEQYRTIKKTNVNLIDKIYYSLPINEDVSNYKNFEIHRKTLSNNVSNRIELITYFFETGIDKELESDLIDILETTRDKLRNLVSKYPDKKSHIEQTVQALVFNNDDDENSYSFWKRIGTQDVEDETNLSEAEKQELIKIASQMIEKNK